MSVGSTGRGGGSEGRLSLLVHEGLEVPRGPKVFTRAAKSASTSASSSSWSPYSRARRSTRCLRQVLKWSCQLSDDVSVGASRTAAMTGSRLEGAVSPISLSRASMGSSWLSLPRRAKYSCTDGIPVSAIGVSNAPLGGRKK